MDKNKNTHTHIYIYIYRERERERERDIKGINANRSMVPSPFVLYVHSWGLLRCRAQAHGDTFVPNDDAPIY
jgi:hypothetical protein